MTFGGEIQRLRKQKGLKQYELAEKLGFKSAYLCDIENGRRKPQSNRFIENVCEVLELTNKERKHLYELSYNLPENITNKKQELLSQIANMELRDQLEAERVKVKKLEEKLKIDNEDIVTLLTDNKKFMELADKYKCLLKECQLLLFDNGFTFDKEDRKKCVDLLARLSEVL